MMFRERWAHIFIACEAAITKTPIDWPLGWTFRAIPDHFGGIDLLGINPSAHDPMIYTKLLPMAGMEETPFGEAHCCDWIMAHAMNAMLSAIDLIKRSEHGNHQETA